jgi:TetR/AcrR family transcriptional repressor of nem operon
MGRTSQGRERLVDAIAELIWVGSYGSTSVDDICAKAGVKKGSFYHFFESKAELAAAAIDAEWQKRRIELDAIFSPIVPPLERFEKLGEFIQRDQKAARDRFGCVLGCPLFALGAEISTQEAKLQKKIEEVLDYKRKYFESAIRDGHAAGVMHAPDAAGKARVLFTYYQGLLTEARIRNDLEVFRDVARGTFALLGVERGEKAA